MGIRLDSRRLDLIAGVALLLWAARPVPALLAWKCGHRQFASAWMLAISPTLSGEPGAAPLVWAFLELPACLAFAVALIAKGLRR